MKTITLQQDNHDKLTINTTEEEVMFWCKKLYRWRKDIFERFKKLGSSDFDRVIYHIYNDQRWGKNRFNNFIK